MAPRRFGPLVVTVAVATLVLLARLFSVQVLEHEVWADQAASLVRSGHVIPYRRGDLLDRAGRVLVHDVESWRVGFAYRDFRREHPLGQVAHALSALEQRCVPLAEAWQRMDELALALVELSPAQLDAWARGEALETAALRLAPSPDRTRHGRRGDAEFYAKRLLDLERGELGALVRQVRKGRREESFLQLAARVRSGARATDAERLRAELRARLADRRAELAHLATLLAAEDPEPPAAGAELARLIERLEGWRTAVEDGAAGALFEEACGFEVGRVAPPTLLAHVDLGWIEEHLRWDPARTAGWLERARAQWLEGLGLGDDPEDAWVLPRLLVEVELAPVLRARTDLVLEGWTRPFLASEDAQQRASLRAWLLGEPPARVRPLAVFAELDDLFAVRLPRGARPSQTALFAFQDPAWLGAPELAGDDVLARAELAPARALDPADPADARLARELGERGAQWREWLRGYEQERFDREALASWTRTCWQRWEQAFQGQLERTLAELAEHARGRLELADGRLDRASERARFALRDYGGRTASVAEAPAYELVHLLARRPESYAGFTVERSHERVQVPYARAGQAVVGRAPLAADLVGRVRTPRLRDLFQRQEEREEFRRLRRLGQRSPREQERFELLAGRVWRDDEQYGSDGLEGYLNPELAGRNGYREERGLQEELERGRRSTDVQPVDGLPVRLTLDAELQLAALETLERPRWDPDESGVDAAWLARPAGAIVLLGVDGEVLAMASYPDAERDGGRRKDDRPLERTLRLYDMQPPGSVLKPFVAAWALERQGLDPGDGLVCAPWEHGGTRAGYKTVHCNVSSGHGRVDLREALRRSCNSYFAWLGDTHYDARSYLEMYAAFGFGQPTGVRCFGPRSGLREDGYRADTQPTERALEPLRARMLATNGLGLPQTTVMQVARAYAGLATGRLPEVRLVADVGGRAVPARSRELPIARANLDFVREATWAAANTTGWPAGSASRALNADALGFAMAAKTGSADLERAREDPDARVLKHTWLAGFLPYDEPRAVLVVFCYRTRATASRSAIWIAQQFLQHPAVRAWLEREGMVP